MGLVSHAVKSLDFTLNVIEKPKKGFQQRSKILVIRHLEIFCPHYVLASFLNHEKLVKIAHCSMKMLY